MQPVSRLPPQQPPVKIYNAVYSSVQVYECMVRGIAVMRRRTDSYVNATQILKVAGVDKGRRTKILEKEILPGKHEIVQGGYGKYQGTWIPLERGRDIAIQYGVAPLLSPLFDFVPNSNPIGALPPGMPNVTGLAPPPIMPGSALRLLNQGRAQGLFTPSTSGAYSSPFPSMSGVSPTPPPLAPTLKRSRSELDADATSSTSHAFASALAASPDIQTSRPASAASQSNGPSPTKRARTEPSPLQSEMTESAIIAQPEPIGAAGRPPSAPAAVNGTSRPASSQSVTLNGKALALNGDVRDMHEIRFASKPSISRLMDPSAPLRDPRRASVMAAICHRDDPTPVLDLLREIAPDNPALTVDLDLVLDDQGHTALHLAASLARSAIVTALLQSGADANRGNYNGETPLVRACLATDNADEGMFHVIVATLHTTIRTLDTSRKSVLHHIVASAGVKGRAGTARYYLDQIFYWIAHHQNGDFRSLVDLQDEHGDTALNIAARVGNRSLVRTLLDVGANRILPNKLGLRPGDFGVETEELGGGPRSEDILSALRAGPSAPVLKSQDVLADMTSMIQSLGADFSSEIKTKQDALDVTQAHLRAATRQLSEQRKQIQAWTARCGELDQAAQRVRNLERALAEEDVFDWTGRAEGAGPAFAVHGQASAMPALDITFSVDVEPAVPTIDSPASLLRLRRLKMWHERVEQLMAARLRSLHGASAEKEFQCKKIVALCTGVPVDKIEDMLENLVIAVESEAPLMDISRVSGFMQKVKNGFL